MIHVRRAALLAAAAILAADDPACAQVDPTVTQRLEQLRREDVPPVPPETLIRTGRDDLILLRERRFFTLYAQPAIRWTNNAALTRNDRLSDWIGSLVAGLRAETRIAQRVDVFADAGVFGARYVQNPFLDFDGWQASIGASAVAFFDVHAALVYNPSGSYTRGFGRLLVTQHALALSATRPTPIIERLTVVPYIAFQYTPSDPNDFSTIGGRAGATLYYGFARDWLAWANVEGFVRSYFDFFEATTGVERRDHGATLVAGVRWQPHDLVSVLGTISFARNFSTVSPLSYSAFNVAPSLQINFRF